MYYVGLASSSFFLISNNSSAFLPSLPLFLFRYTTVVWVCRLFIITTIIIYFGCVEFHFPFFHSSASVGRPPAPPSHGTTLREVEIAEKGRRAEYREVAVNSSRDRWSDCAVLLISPRERRASARGGGGGGGFERRAKQKKEVGDLCVSHTKAHRHGAEWTI